MHRCNKCGKVRQDSLYYDSNPRVCKICLRKYGREHYRKNRDRLMDYQREYSRNSERRREYSEEYRIMQFLKRRASDIVQHAVKTGKLKKFPCAICGDTNSEGHHEDYSKPLDVIWLCRKHHKWIHRK